MNQILLKNEAFILDGGLWDVWFHHIIVLKQRKAKLEYTTLASVCVGFQFMEWYYAHLGWVLPPHISISGNPLRHNSKCVIYLLGHSKSSQYPLPVCKCIWQGVYEEKDQRVNIIKKSDLSF